MSLKAIIKVLRDKRSQEFLISTHVRPDVDGLASSLAIAAYLMSLKKKVQIVIDDDLPSMYEFIPKVRSIRKYHDEKIKYDVAIILDCGDFNRIGHVKKTIDSNKPRINIDHHVTNDGFGTVNHVDTKASSTSEIVFELLKEAGFPLNPSVAMLLYMGIMTDTGSFRYDNTTARTHEVVSHLMRFKFPVSKLYNKIYESVPLDNIKLFTKVVNNFQVSHDGKVVSVELNKRILEKFSGDFDLRDKIFSFLRSIKGVEVIVIFSESKKKLIRVNFRSQGAVDVASLAAFWGGGGHAKASGCCFATSLETAKEKVFSKINRLLR